MNKTPTGGTMKTEYKVIKRSTDHFKYGANDTQYAGSRIAIIHIPTGRQVAVYSSQSSAFAGGRRTELTYQLPSDYEKIGGTTSGDWIKVPNHAESTIKSKAVVRGDIAKGEYTNWRQAAKAIFEEIYGVKVGR